MLFSYREKILVIIWMLWTVDVDMPSECKQYDTYEESEAMRYKSKQTIMMSCGFFPFCITNKTHTNTQTHNSNNLFNTFFRAGSLLWQRNSGKTEWISFEMELKTCTAINLQFFTVRNAGEMDYVILIFYERLHAHFTRSLISRFHICKSQSTTQKDR